MKQFVCEMCGSSDLIKQDGVFVCQFCGCKYSVEEAKRMMIEGTVDVTGSTVKVDNSAFVQKYLDNARRAYGKEDWEEVEKYYNMVEQNSPHNMEAVFFSAFGKAALSLTDDQYYKREQKFHVLLNSISVINDYYELTSENKEDVLNKIFEAISKMYTVNFIYQPDAGKLVGGREWQRKIFDSVRDGFLTELNQIAEIHSDTYIQDLIKKVEELKAKSGGCYVATAVYGSYDCPQVWTLRRFRDFELAKTWYGRVFIHTYYAISPTIVKWFGETEWFKTMWRGTLDRMVDNLQAEGYEDTPYEDINW